MVLYLQWCVVISTKKREKMALAHNKDPTFRTDGMVPWLWSLRGLGYAYLAPEKGPTPPSPTLSGVMNNGIYTSSFLNDSRVLSTLLYIKGCAFVVYMFACNVKGMWRRLNKEKGDGEEMRQWGKGGHVLWHWLSTSQHHSLLTFSICCGYQGNWSAVIAPANGSHCDQLTT